MSKFKSGDKCAICGKEWKPKARFANHHVSYQNEITVIVCFACHSLLHGSARIYKHPFGHLGKDRSPYEFARKVLIAYKRALHDNEPMRLYF